MDDEKVIDDQTQINYFVDLKKLYNTYNKFLK